MKDLRSYRQFTGIKLEQNLEKKTISLSKRVYVKKALEHTDMLDYKPVQTPIVSRIYFSKNVNEPLDKEFVCLYQSHVGTHMWAYVCTCPNPGFAVCTLYRFSSNPTCEYIIAV